jgi:hypothetical protein
MVLPVDTSVTKKWIVITPDDDKYGIYSCKEIYSFLKYFYNRHDELKDKHVFMVADIDNDIYYLPDSLIEILAGEVGSGSPIKLTEDAKELEKIILNKLHYKGQQTRRLMEYPRLITKYDILEMNQNFKTPIINVPFKGLKNQLRSLGKRNTTYLDRPLDMKPVVSKKSTSASSKEVIMVVNVNDLFI